MKYVLMYTGRPDLDEAVPKERIDQVYGEIFAWFEKNAAAMTLSLIHI